MQTLNEAKRELNNHLAERPQIIGLPGFNAKDHIANVNEWLERKVTLTDAVDRLTSADEKARLAEYDHRKRSWISKHYPCGSTGGSNHGE